MEAEIISVGTELLLGQICNTNAQFLSKRLAEIGINVFYHTAVGDNPTRLLNVVRSAEQRSNIIIFTGGLGPTKDDLTKETLAAHLGKTRVEHKQAMDRIHNYFKQRGIEMTANNRKQSEIIEGSVVFPNDHGMAPGMAIEVNDIHYLLLPGPPRELHPMYDRYTIPYLQSLFQEKYTVHSKTLRFFGIGESMLEEKLIDLIDQQTNPTIALLASEAEVSVRLTAKAKDLDEANERIATLEAELQARVGDSIYGYDDDSLASVVSHLLKQKSWSLAAAESCSGGAISQSFTELPGASEVFAGGIVSYSADAKMNALGVDADLIEQYGTVSEQTARTMAIQARKLFSADIGVSVTGVAGPEPTENKAVGVVFIGVSTKQGVEVFAPRLSGSRQNIQLRAAKYALFYVYEWLNRL
ncbi:competence/damage-inducible protein A [Ammoniphilus oxalaticus]|uniref:Putative competence-damage inducible protein n=1 Tax=Ammoniphilus oxalaticus TaxID=66863 RepID=A0A419SL13_9BACL|nr:competence/damage-inducible protein A [Ammoniphilus oxalaticus]RKD24693.1 competence/damage-inducible protein A [Ammoniphilus oxalaticus]